MLERLPSVMACTQEQALVLARLATAIGFQFRLGGLLDQAIEHYINGKVAFYKLENLEDYYEEYTFAPELSCGLRQTGAYGSGARFSP